jgi:ABC-type antimicrobial peptide transport system permease subunit
MVDTFVSLFLVTEIIIIGLFARNFIINFINFINLIEELSPPTFSVVGKILIFFSKLKF